MPSQTNEQALESAIEKHLTGICLEEMKENGQDFAQVNEPGALYKSANDYFIGNPKDFNAKFAIDEVRFWHFLEGTQADELAKLQKQSDWKLNEYKSILINGVVMGEVELDRN